MSLPENFYVPTGGEPKFRCRLCQAPFKTFTPFQRHVIRCARENEQAIQEARPSHRLPVIYDSEVAQTKDIEDFVERNRTALQEGRKKL